MDYQGNSKLPKEETEEVKEEKEIEVVLSGPVIQKPKGFLHKVKGVFFGGDFRSAGMSVWADVFLPAARNMLFDVWTRSAEQVIFGDSYRRRPPEPRGRTQYDMMSRSPMRDPYRDVYPEPRDYGRGTARLPDQSYRPRRANPRDTDDIVLQTRADAEIILDFMFRTLDRYNVISLGELKARLGLPTSHIDEKWGWTYLHDINIRQVSEGFLIELPPMIDI